MATSQLTNQTTVLRVFKKESSAGLKEAAIKLIHVILKRNSSEVFGSDFDPEFFFSACEKELTFMRPKAGVRGYIYRTMAGLLDKFPSLFDNKGELFAKDLLKKMSAMFHSNTPDISALVGTIKALTLIIGSIEFSIEESKFIRTRTF